MEWIKYAPGSLPPANTRVLISDGNIITIASWANDGDSRMWFFERDNYKDVNITWWTNLPTCPPVVVPFEDPPLTE